jgi:serine/threonine protein kinase
VYAVVDTALGRTVARKELLDGADAGRLRREARVTASLEHPGIVPVYDAGEDAHGRPWYTMRVASRHTLADAIAEAGGASRRRVALVRRVLAAAEAVAYAHTRGVVHRDLKPANILVGEHGETQVADWGLAVSVGDGATGPTALPVGTPAWMSPEQAAGAPADPRFDVYALGAILLAVATGRPPFHDLPSSEVLAALRRGEALAPRPEDGPAELVAIARQALAADPSQRYAGAGAFAEELARWLDGERVRHTDLYDVDDIRVPTELPKVALPEPEPWLKGFSWDDAFVDESQLATKGEQKYKALLLECKKLNANAQSLLSHYS